VPEFIYTITPKPPELATKPGAWTEAEKQTAQLHFAYLDQAAKDGVVILAGRAQDGIGPAIVVFEAESDEAAKQFLERDPFMADGLMTGSLHPYRVAVSRERAKET